MDNSILKNPTSGTFVRERSQINNTEKAFSKKKKQKKPNICSPSLILSCTITFGWKVLSKCAGKRYISISLTTKPA